MPVSGKTALEQAGRGARAARKYTDLAQWLPGAARLAASALPGAGYADAGESFASGRENIRQGEYLKAAIDYLLGGTDAVLESLPMTAALPAVAPMAKKGIRAYHGSPHDFDKFSMDKIGTGEGAQAYGHGLYFAEAEDVAEFYRDNYAKPDASDFKTDTARQLAQDQLQSWAGDIDGGIADLRASLGNEKISRMFGDADEARIADLEDAIAYMERGAPKGKMYEVNINADPDDFLDWDKPLSEQTGAAAEYIQNMKDLGLYEPGLPNIETPRNMLGDLARQTWKADGKPPTGPDSKYHAMVANELRREGIPGIKYLDQGSRGAGEGTRNYVVFDDSLIEIVRKYGIGALVIAGVLSQSQGEALAAQGYPE